MRAAAAKSSVLPPVQEPMYTRSILVLRQSFASALLSGEWGMATTGSKSSTLYLCFEKYLACRSCKKRTSGMIQMRGLSALGRHTCRVLALRTEHHRASHATPSLTKKRACWRAGSYSENLALDGLWKNTLEARKLIVNSRNSHRKFAVGGGSDSANCLSSSGQTKTKSTCGR